MLATGSAVKAKVVLTTKSMVMSEFDKNLQNLTVFSHFQTYRSSSSGGVVWTTWVIPSVSMQLVQAK